MLLITGIMVGYMTSSVISLLNYMSSADGVHSYVMWGMGNFNGVSLSRLPLFALMTLAGIVMALPLIKPLNIILLGSNYARNLGISMRRVRNLLYLPPDCLQPSSPPIAGLYHSSALPCLT